MDKILFYVFFVIIVGRNHFLQQGIFKTPSERRGLGIWGIKNGVGEVVGARKK